MMQSFVSGVSTVLMVSRVFLFLLLSPVVRAADAGAAPTTTAPSASAPGWRDLAMELARQPGTTARFEERRYFPYQKDPIVLQGEVRVSHEHGLSLHYEQPEERTVIVDDRGLLLRDSAGTKTPPPDPRATMANEALLLVLRFDFVELEKKFELSGRREGNLWSLILVPRDATVKKTIGEIHVGGEGATVRRIELRRSAKQHIDILIEAPSATAAFSEDELKRYFR
jgi:hypothetical protein